MEGLAGPGDGDPPGGGGGDWWTHCKHVGQQPVFEEEEDDGEDEEYSGDDPESVLDEDGNVHMVIEPRHMRTASAVCCSSRYQQQKIKGASCRGSPFQKCNHRIVEASSRGGPFQKINHRIVEFK